MNSETEHNHPKPGHEYPNSGHESHGWRSRNKIVLIGFAVMAGFFLLSEHRAHVVEWLPWLFLLACPLMHIFMHGGHGGGRKHD